MISSVGTGAILGGTTGVTPVIPTHASGDMLVASVAAKPTATGTPPTVNTPSGWTALLSGTDASGLAQGADTGQVWIFTFYREATSGSETNPAFTVTNGNVCMGQVNSWRKTNVGSWSISAVIGADTTSATSWSTNHNALPFQSGDVLDYRAGSRGNGASLTIFPTTTPSNPTASGASFTFINQATPVTNDGGNDMAGGNYNWRTIAGLSTGVTVALTLTGSTAGVAAAIRLREPAGAMMPPRQINRFLHLLRR